MASRASWGAVSKATSGSPSSHCKREQTARGQALLDPRHAHERPVGEHDAIEPGDLGLMLIIELLAHPFPDLARNLPRVDRRAGAATEREQEVEVCEVGLHRRGHVRILQLAGEPLAGEARGPMHLAERRGGRGLEVEIGEALAPVRPELGLHPAAHEGRPHRRRLRLEPHQLGGEIRRQYVGDRRQHLRDFHQRALHRAQARTRAPWRPSRAPPPQPVDADPRDEPPALTPRRA